MAGIACREATQWRVQALLPTGARRRIRRTATPPGCQCTAAAVLAIVEAESTAELDAEAEAAAQR
jgi:hypothetical protein